MSTDELYKKLSEKAEIKLKNNLHDAGLKYRKSLGWRARAEYIVFDDGAGNQLSLGLDRVISQIEEALFERGISAARKEEVSNFLESVSNFQEHVNALESLD